jgi:hypothetical protein
MRLGERDAFRATDPALRHALSALDPRASDPVAAAEPWRPWRALAATHLLAHHESPAHAQSPRPAPLTEPTFALSGRMRQFAPQGPAAEDGTLSFRVYRDPAQPDYLLFVEHAERLLLPVVHDDLDMAGEAVAGVRGFAAVGPRDRLDVLGPPPAGIEDGPATGRGRGRGSGPGPWTGISPPAPRP